MITEMFNILSQLETLFWGYAGFSIIIILGIYFTYTTGVFQISGIPTVLRTIHKFIVQESPDGRGIHPLKTFFASVGGMVGVGNVVGIITALQFGGPGALFWVWVAGFVGSLIKFVLHRSTSEKVKLIGTVLMAFSGVVLVLAAIMQPTNPYPFTIAMAIFAFGTNWSQGLYFPESMEIFPQIRGITASLLTSIRLLMTAAIVGCSSLLYNGTIYPVVGVITATILITFVISIVYERSRVPSPAL